MGKVFEFVHLTDQDRYIHTIFTALANSRSVFKHLAINPTCQKRVDEINEAMKALELLEIEVDCTIEGLQMQLKEAAKKFVSEWEPIVPLS